MTFVLYFTTLIMNLFFGLKKRSNQIVTVVSLLLIYLFMAGAGPFYPFIADYHRYIVHYDSAMNNSIFSTQQFGYHALMKLGNIAGLPFDIFRLIVMAVCLFMLYKWVIKRYKVNANYIIALYMGYGLIMDSEQFRNWIALTVLLVGLHFLESDRAIDKGKFILILGIATSFHISFIFYMPLIFVNGKQRNYKITIFAILSLLIALIIILNGNQIPYQQRIVQAIGDRRVENYLSSTTNFGWIIPAFLHATSIVLSFWSRKIIQNKHYYFSPNFEANDPLYEEKKLIQNELNIANMIFWINIAMTMLFPIYIINVQFYRLMRSLLLITYVICAKASYYIKRRTPNIFFNGVVLFSVFLWLGIDLIHRISPNRLLLPFFFNNLL